jgi:hypothetical protein
MADITDDFLAVAVGCREAGVPRDECLDIVHSTFDAPWDSEAEPTRVGFARRLVEKVFDTPRRCGAVRP